MITHRDKLAAAAAAAVCRVFGDEIDDVDHHELDVRLATAALDSALPQISTPVELAELPAGAVAVDVHGSPWELDEFGDWMTTGIARGFSPQEVFAGIPGQIEGPRGPLTVVWQP